MGQQIDSRPLDECAAVRAASLHAYLAGMPGSRRGRPAVNLGCRTVDGTSPLGVYRREGAQQQRLRIAISDTQLAARLLPRAPRLRRCTGGGYLGDPEQNWSFGTLSWEFTARTNLSCTVNETWGN